MILKYKVPELSVAGVQIILCILAVFSFTKTSQLKSRITHSHVFLFAKEAHANVVPERGALRHGACCHSVLVHGHIKVTVGLHHAAYSQDGLEI